MNEGLRLVPDVSASAVVRRRANIVIVVSNTIVNHFAIKMTSYTSRRQLQCFDGGWT
jgi:hypothetical protein